MRSATGLLHLNTYQYLNITPVIIVRFLHPLPILPFLILPFLISPFLFCLKLSAVWDNLLSSISKRNFLLEFANGPAELMERLLTSHHSDVVDYASTLTTPDFLKEYETADQTPEFYQKVKYINI